MAELTAELAAKLTAEFSTVVMADGSEATNTLGSDTLKSTPFPAAGSTFGVLGAPASDEGAGLAARRLVGTLRSNRETSDVGADDSGCLAIVLT
jgi:hypothetical protein